MSEQWRIQGRGRGPAPLFSDQSEARRAEKFFFFFETGSPPFSQGQDQRPPSLSEGLDLPLVNESVSHSPMVTA